MTLLDAEPRTLLSAITEIALIETGSRSAREHWQQIQLRNLVKHVTERSAFWRSRIGSRKASDVDLAALPILTRQDLRTQVVSEGPLLRSADGFTTKAHSTSGSSGVPVQFFVSDFNGNYNGIRSCAQFFMDGLDLSLNRTRIRTTNSPVRGGIDTHKDKTWIGSLATLFKPGISKWIAHFTLTKGDIRKLIRELEQDDIGYLVCAPRIIDAIGTSVDLRFLKTAKTAMWIPLSEHVNPKLTEKFASLSIPVRANYSSEEVGMIGNECSKFSGHYHVTSSNVIIEVVDRRFEIEGLKLGKVLVTHLHSYATPFIRYDLGDFALLSDKCPCGHDGPTIYNLQGRESRLVKHRDGRLTPFVILSKDLTPLVNFTEYRMRQTAFGRIVVEFGGRSELQPEEIAAVSAFLKERTGPEFDFEIKSCPEIDWGKSLKRPGFRCEI